MNSPVAVPAAPAVSAPVWSAPCGLPSTNATALCEWLYVGTDACARDYAWFEAQAAAGTPVRFMVSCVSPPHRAQSPVKFENEYELGIRGDLADTAKVHRSEWGTTLRIATKAKTSGTRVLFHSPDGLVAALLGAAVVMTIDGPAVHKPLCGVLRQWMPAGGGGGGGDGGDGGGDAKAKDTTTDTFLGILKGFEGESSGSGSGSGTATRCRVCLQDA
jgi:hypothetical protein